MKRNLVNPSANHITDEIGIIFAVIDRDGNIDILVKIIDKYFDFLFS